jgi:hypothetical protein
MNGNTDSKHRSIIYILLIIYLVLHLLFKITFHELWKDEWQAWFVVRDLSTLDVLRFLYYEGHPFAWYLYLKPFSYLKSLLPEHLLLQIAHFIPYAASVLLLFSFKKPGQIWKATILSGYFFLFEYAMISRSYILVVLLLLYSLKMILNENTKSWLFFPVFFLLANTEIYGLIAAGAFVLYFILEHMESSSGDRLNLRKIHAKIYWSIAGLFFGALIFWYSMDWAPDASQTRERLFTILSNIEGKTGWDIAFQGIFGNAFLPGLVKDAHSFGVTPLGIVVAGIALALTAFILSADKKVLLSYLSFCLVAYSFAALSFAGGLRQWGMIFVFFIICFIWINQHKTLTKWGYIAFALLCVFQTRYALIATTRNISYPFSHSKDAGEYIRDNIPLQIPIVAISPFNTAAPSGYAGRKFYQLPDGVEFSYFRWIDKVYIPPQSELLLFARFKQSPELFVITHTPLEADRFPLLILKKKWESFSLKNENYYLYRLSLPKD